MSRSEELTAKFEAANEQVIAAVESCSDAQWGAISAAEQWSAGVVAHHIAMGYSGILGFAQMIATGQTLPPLTTEMIDGMNAEHAQQFAKVTKAETLDLLRTNGSAAAAMLRGLSDEQLDQTASSPVLGPEPVSTQQMIEGALFGGTQEHLASFRQASGQGG